ncbi:homoserine O-acetyltransferase [Halovenus aranensis]|uniref:Homoserine O-acetyltransferase n=1 Tax=Halovenus aranensis TaxID=890420 RepID=A0A1G8UT77_9EURY|nr:homoserine O-acetyltransferase [Halovenus aranensis]SDJ57003.1 homoserine O-acetyltransferase [Halovenus aranensis]
MTRVTAETVSLGEFTFECGETIPDLAIAYEAYGEFDGENAVLVCHALTGSQNVADIGDATSGQAGQAAAWWHDIVGPGKPIDTNEYYVVCANVPGSCYGSSGPASHAPDGRGAGEHGRWGPAFPAVTVGDWTRAQRRLLDALGVDRLHAVVGGSVGGMNALEWVARYPSDVDLVAPVATAPRLDTQCLSLDAVARRAIRSDSNWNGGNYYDRQPPRDGLALARQLGHIMYLSKESMDRKFGRREADGDTDGHDFPADPARERFAYRDVESYLDYQAASFVKRFDANAYLYLTRAMDAYDLADGRGSTAEALVDFEGEALVISFTGDWHFTVEQADCLTAAFRESDTPVTHRVVESDHGHDAFLVETDAVGPPLARFLANGVENRTQCVADR